MDVLVDFCIDRVLSGTADVHQDEYHQIDECQLALDDACTMNMEESDEHDCQHGNHAQTIECTDYKTDGAKHLCKDGTANEKL